MSTRSLPALIGRRYASFGNTRVMTGFISRLSVIGLAMGVAILITAMSIMNGFDRELREKVLAMLPHMTVTTLPNYRLESLAVWEEISGQLANNPEIAGIAPLVSLQGMLIANGRSRGVAVNGVIPEQESQVSIIDQFTRGGSLARLVPGEYGMLIGSALAGELGLVVGDDLMLVSSEVPVTILGARPSRKRFRVEGIFTTGSLLDASLVYVSLEDASRLYRLGGGIHGIRIQLHDLFATGEVAGEIRPLLPDSSRISLWSYEFGAVYQNIQLSKTLVGLLLFMLIAVAAFNVVVSLAMIVKDKQGDIAILRTMGASEKQIRGIFIVQGGMIGVTGSGAGLLLGVLFSLVITDFMAWIESASGFKLFNADVYPVDYLPSQLSLTDCALVVIVSLLLCLLASVLPARSAARIRPAEALRFE